MDALVEYVVTYDPKLGIEIDEPAEVLGGHTQYDLRGPADADVLYCATNLTQCSYEGALAAFLPSPERSAHEATDDQD
jgi:hypothetical protein